MPQTIDRATSIVKAPGAIEMHELQGKEITSRYMIENFES